MKILHLNSLENGGAFKAADRINSSLKTKITSELFIFKDRKNIFRNLFSKPYSVIDKIISDAKTKSKNTTFSSNSVPFSYIPILIKIKDPDIVHLHWINAGMISIKDLLKIKKPIVWTMHDYWPFSGGYHYPESDKISNDVVNQKILENKRIIYNQIQNIRFVAVSKKLMEDAKISSVLKNKKISYINNPLDLKHFNIKDKLECKKKINLDNNLTILFCSSNSIFKKNKNFNFLLKVLNKLSEFKKINFIICGEKNMLGQKINLSTNINLLETGFIENEEELSIIYNAADITAIPSNKEAFGQIASESCACGTPTIVLKNTGLTDIVIHKENGYVCDEANEDKFIDGIKWLENNNTETMREKCKDSISRFSYNNISNQYIKIYNEVLNK